MAVQQTKIHAHGLTRTTTGISRHYCDACRSSLSESYRCAPCNFDLCGACFGKNKSTQATRVHAHPVTYTTTGLDSHFCDVCSAPTTRESWRCTPCNFDVCTTCFETIKAPKPAPAPRPAPAAEVKAAPLTVAQHAHPLTSTSGLSGHFCDGCKVAVTTSYRCAPCNWDLCPACYTKSLQRVSRLHTHPLTHTTSGLESHFCDGCRVPTEAESWRCADCNFDLCTRCVVRTAAPKAPAAAAAAAAAPAEAKAPVAAAPAEVKLHEHTLTRTTTGLSGHHCDGCRASPMTVSFRCDACNYDLCSACNERTRKQVLSLHPHAVTYTTGASLDRHFCDGCRGAIAGVAWRCDGCDFDLCPTCVDRCKAPKPAAPAPAPEAKAAPVVCKAHAHPLTRTTTGLSGHHCDGCRATALTVSHRCDACNFDLCGACFARNRLAHTSRMHAHPLAFARGLTAHWCDDCRKPVTSAWRCDDCNFDLCLGCFARAKLPKKCEVKAAPAPAPAAATPAPAAAEQFAVKGHAHKVSLVTSGLTGHFCDACRASPLTRAYRCDGCNYDLCPGCFEAARVTVTSRVHTHPLKWTSGLSAHYCDVCRKTAAEAYRCDSCNFDCCSSCLAAAAAAPVPAAAAPAAFWSCAACTYVNPSSGATCYICSSAKP